MAHKPQQEPRPPEPRPFQEIVAQVAVYPEAAYEFVSVGLSATVEKIHASTPPDDSHHVSGQQLALGLRDFAWERWGLLARMVLSRWNVTSTMDFGKIVYALIEAGLLSKTDSDRLEDFRNVYDFATLETQYRSPASLPTPPCPKK